MASGRETVIPVPPTQDYDLKQIDWISLVGKTLHFLCRVQSLVAELRSHMLHSVAKKKKRGEADGLQWKSQVIVKSRAL